MDTTTIASALVWVWGLVFFGVVLYRLKKRRGHIGAAGAGSIYDIVQQEKRNAIEVIVADKAAARDFEHADDDDPPQSNKVN